MKIVALAGSIIGSKTRTAMHKFAEIVQKNTRSMK